MILDGKATSAAIYQELKARLDRLSTQAKLVAILVGDNPASHLYVSSKISACRKVGIVSEKLLLPSSTSQSVLLEHLERLNRDDEVTGILVQLPLPTHIDPLLIAKTIHPKKDVDGVSPINHGKLVLGDTMGFIPCTPLGILTLLEKYQIPTAARHVVIAGRSNIVGKPLAALMLQKSANSTVTVVHSHTPNIATYSRQADILVAAIGKANFFTADMIKEGAVIIDVGQNRTDRLVGDVDFTSVEKKCSWITPVPGGVGPMTIAMLLSNTVKALDG